MLLLCILPEGRFPGTDVANPAKSPLAGLTIHPLTLWIRDAPHAPAASVEEVRAHHRIVELAWNESPSVLPVRFGQWFASEADLRAAIEPRADEYVRGLERVKGAAEFSIRILDPSLEEAPPPERSTGTAYLRGAAERVRERAGVEARGRSLAEEMKQALGGLVREDRVESLASPHGLCAVAHLVSRDQEREYLSAADRFAGSKAGLRFLRTGPWPAWSFTA